MKINKILGTGLMVLALAVVGLAGGSTAKANMWRGGCGGWNRGFGVNNFGLNRFNGFGGGDNLIINRNFSSVRPFGFGSGNNIGGVGLGDGIGGFGLGDGIGGVGLGDGVGGFGLGDGVGGFGLGGGFGGNHTIINTNL